jgi:NTE family protein
MTNLTQSGAIASTRMAPAKTRGTGKASRRGKHARTVSLALQGGGSFGAFAWGFLDRLLEEDDLSFDSVSGASAGALNAVLLADGLAAGGPDEARRRLARFWRGIGHAPHLPAGAGQLPGVAALFELSTRLASPYQFNPLGLNPLRGKLLEEVDFARLREESPVRLLIAATRVKDGGLRIFREDEMTVEAVLASSCLPFLHHATEIDGEAYWDGGYSANPPIRQLVIDSRAKHIVLVQLIPETHGDVPHLTGEISRRMQEIAFTSSLHRELEAFEDLREVCRRSPLTASPVCRRLQDLKFHRVVAADFVEGLDQESALDTRWPLLTRLHERGRAAAATWLAENPARGTRARRITSRE